MAKKFTTTTEAMNYMLKVYLEQGWITPKQVKEIKRDSFIVTLGIVLLPIAGGVLFYLLVIWGR